jgi:glycosyltransferase involved in cell wall biosynthesis
MRNVLFFFSNTLIGGAETNIVKISSELKTRGFNVFFASFENNGPLIYDNHLEAYYLDLGKFSINPLKSLKKYRRFLIDNNINVVSAFGLRVDLYVRVFSHLFKSDIKIISNIRASENWRNYFHVILDRLTSFKVDMWVSNSISARDTFYRREKIDLSKSKVIYNFIDFDKDYVCSDETIEFLKIGILANYKKSKGHFNLPSICNELDKRNVKYIIYCAGFDYTNGEFKKIIQNNSLDQKVNILGHISDKKHFFSTIDVFFLPSYIEGLSTSMLEAMSYGVPVVASNVDGMPEGIISGLNGFLRAPNDFEGFAADLAQIVLPEVRNKFVINSYSMLSDKFCKEKNIKFWEAVFSE